MSSVVTNPNISISLNITEIESINLSDTGSIIITFKQFEPIDIPENRQFPQSIYVDKSYTIVLTEDDKLLIEK